MIINRKKLIIFASCLIIIVLSALLLSSYRASEFDRALTSYTEALALKGELQSALLRIQLNALKSQADAYTSAKDEMLRLAGKRINSYNSSLLVLVNPWNETPASYAPKLTTVEEGYVVDRRCAAALTAMLEDCRLAGNSPVICSAYRTQAYQQELFDNKVKRLLAEGINRTDAPELAARSVAVPGTSEHQLGLAVDIIDYYNVNLDESQERTSTQQWLMTNCASYGFILRYPNGSSDSTGIIYEPWHYRYVGRKAAAEIMERGITLEEYLSANR